VLKKNASNKIATLIVAFPPVILLIYAIVTYIVFIHSQDTTNKRVLKIQEKILIKSTEDVLKTRVDSINNFINREENLKDIYHFFKSLVIKDSKHILILTPDNKVVFNSGKLDGDRLNLIKNLKSAFAGKNLIVAINKNNKFNWKIVSYCTREHSLEKLELTKKELNKTTLETIRKNMIWLAVSWFVLLILSLILSIVVFNRLKTFENALIKTNENIIFQSRQALLGELLPMIAHQWRQPLNKIAAVLMRIRFELEKGNPSVDTIDRQAQQIEDSVELMSNTIDDFRTFYRPKENAEYVDLALLIRKAVYFLDELLHRKKIKIKNDLASVEVKLHANEFLQVIINLIKNASDATGVKGQISVTLREIENNQVEIRVEDDGTGIPEDKLEKIFEPHESTKQGSMGLGLYMSKLIIESHFGGIIKAYNTPRGAGFLIRLPKDGK